MWWQYALWGLTGAAVNRALIYLEAVERIKGNPWRWPYGPGGRLYLISVLIHCGIAAAVVGALSASAYVHDPATAIGLGLITPVAIKKVSMFALAHIPGPENVKSIMQMEGNKSREGDQ